MQTPRPQWLEARAAAELIWLVDGQQVGCAQAGMSLTHRFAEAGRHAITAMDEFKRYDWVEIQRADRRAQTTPSRDPDCRGCMPTYPARQRG